HLLLGRHAALARLLGRGIARLGLAAPHAAAMFDLSAELAALIAQPAHQIDEFPTLETGKRRIVTTRNRLVFVGSQKSAFVGDRGTHVGPPICVLDMISPSKTAVDPRAAE